MTANRTYSDASKRKKIVIRRLIPIFIRLTIPICKSIKGGRNNIIKQLTWDVNETKWMRN